MSGEKAQRVLHSQLILLFFLLFLRGRIPKPLCLLSPHPEICLHHGLCGCLAGVFQLRRWLLLLLILLLICPELRECLILCGRTLKNYLDLFYKKVSIKKVFLCVRAVA